MDSDETQPLGPDTVKINTSQQPNLTHKVEIGKPQEVVGPAFNPMLTIMSALPHSTVAVTDELDEALTRLNNTADIINNKVTDGVEDSLTNETREQVAARILPKLNVQFFSDGRLHLDYIFSNLGGRRGGSPPYMHPDNIEPLLRTLGVIPEKSKIKNAYDPDNPPNIRLLKRICKQQGLTEISQLKPRHTGLYWTPKNELLEYEVPLRPPMSGVSVVLSMFEHTLNSGSYNTPSLRDFDFKFSPAMAARIKPLDKKQWDAIGRDMQIVTPKLHEQWEDRGEV